MVAKSFNKKIQRLCQLSSSGRSNEVEPPINQDHYEESPPNNPTRPLLLSGNAKEGPTQWTFR